MSGQQRDARFNMIFGTNGTGKSTFVGQILQKTHFKNALVYIESVDRGGTPFKGIPVAPFAQYAGGKACIDADETDIVTFLTQCAEKYRNGLLILDEAGMYTHEIFDKGEPIPPLKELLKQRRKFNVEIYFIYHSAAEAPIRLFKWCNNVILAHQTDIFKHKAGFIPRIDELNAAQQRIAAKYFAGDHYYKERIQLS